MIHKLQDFFQKYAFGVCEWWGDKLGLKSSKIRLFFYLPFLFNHGVSADYIPDHGFHFRTQIFL